MGYSKSKQAVIRMKPFLDRLESSRSDVEWASDDPTKLAYKIREAIHAAKHHEGLFHYSQLGDLYIFRVQNNSVYANYTGGKKPVEVRRSGEPTQPEPTSKEIMDVDSVMGIIGAVIKHEEVEEFYFPDAVLLPSDIRKLYQWATKNGWKIINHEDLGLTLTSKKLDESLIWTPT